MTDRIINETRITVRGMGAGGGAGEVTVSVSSRPRARGRSPAQQRLHALQLPPIICSVSPGSSDASPRSGRPREWREGGQSRYHRACCDRASAAPSAPSGGGGGVAANTPRGVPAPKRTGGVVDESAVVAFLESRSQFLDQYVAERVELSVLERWLVRKTKDSPTSKQSRSSLSRWELCAHADKRDMLQNMMESLKAQPSKETVVWELARCVSAAVGVDGCVVYELDRFEPENVFVYCGGDSAECVSAQEKRLAVQAAQLCRPLRLARSTDLCDFPQGICTDPGAEYVMYQPVVEAGGDSAVVVELWRREQPFTPEDDEVCAAYLAWGGIALHHAQLYLNMDKQKHLSDFLLDVVKSIFQDMISMEAVVTKVMNFAQKLVHADRASLFLVDPDTDELYATVFDVGVEDSSAGDAKAASGSEASAPKSNVKEIRFPIGTGIAGHVAKTGEVLNITDAYEDDRFNRTVDNLTGYKTKTILCMPIYIRNAIIGVVQMVNKKSGPFTSVDERAFEMFAVYCGLALHHAKLYDHIRRSQQKYKVALDVLSYHSTCTDEEVKTLLKLDVCSRDVGLDNFYFSPFACAEYEKVVHAIYMFNDLFSKSLSFDHMSVVKFVLTVKKNYRRVPYHNWTHGFAVANCMYNIVRHTNAFSRIEKLALFTGALCHDLDHRGKNNKYMLDTESPLAAMYSTSTLEHHHFNQTITILQQDGHNIISQLSSAEYKQVLTLLKRCILATDLAAFFPNRARLAQLINDDQFDWHKREHRMLVLAISMTASDLSASAKPWAVQVETVKVIFQEFYEQGDAERAHGRPSLAMMDRNRPEEQADSQVGFLRSICVPCYSLLSGLLPQTLPLLRMCEENLARWEELERQVKAELAAGRLPTHLYIAIERDQ